MTTISQVNKAIESLKVSKDYHKTSDIEGTTYSIHWGMFDKYSLWHETKPLIRFTGNPQEITDFLNNQ